MKVICFGVREYERNIFEEIEREYSHTLVLSSTYIDDSTYEEALGYEAIIIRANCNLSKSKLSILKKNGLKYLLTRTIGYNHILLDACKEIGIKVAYAPGYSPSSIAELSVSLAMCILRNVPEAISNATKYDFTLYNTMFGREIRNSTVGILGCGRIGKEAARIYHSLGARVLGFDLYEDENMNGIITYTSLDNILQKSDIISIHMSYSKDTNYHFIGQSEFNKMKKGTILINTARGELIDTDALISNIKSEKLLGAGLDVVEREKDIFFKANFLDKLSFQHKQLIDLYPRVIITPHISSSTDSAVYDSLKISLRNLNELIASGTCKNLLV